MAYRKLESLVSATLSLVVGLRICQEEPWLLSSWALKDKAGNSCHLQDLIVLILSHHKDEKLTDLT